MTISRCKWAESIKDEEYLAYHDDEWSEPLTTDRDLFELLCLEGAQAGLSWLTVLKKRKNYRSSFHMFDISRVALMTEADERRVLESGGVVKHSGKIKVLPAFPLLTQNT
jgi:DNA-3-methyladenine glycosylase I